MLHNKKQYLIFLFLSEVIYFMFYCKWNLKDDKQIVRSHFRHRFSLIMSEGFPEFKFKEFEILTLVQKSEDFFRYGASVKKKHRRQRQLAPQLTFETSLTNVN